jgi:hypothetical protein
MGHERLSEAHRPDSVTTRLKRIGAFIVFAGAMFLLVQIFALIDAEVYLRSWGCHSATVTEIFPMVDTPARPVIIAKKPPRRTRKPQKRRPAPKNSRIAKPALHAIHSTPTDPENKPLTG